MTNYKRGPEQGLSGNVSSGVSGSVGARKGSSAVPKKKAEKKDWPRWISHRGGPFLIHNNAACDPGAMGCNNSVENLIEQGFAPCPRKCEGATS